jgi:hypothetical protein
VLKKLQSVWRRLKPHDSTAVASAEDSSLLAVRWLEADDPANPFDVSGCDCLGFVGAMLSSTPDSQSAARFLELRSDDGRALVGKLPDAPREMACDLLYPYVGEVRDGVLFKAGRMEEKWDIYLYQSKIYFCRSWTSNLLYVAHFSADGQGVAITKIVAAGELAADPTLPVRQVDYLNKSHLFGRAAPHPLPAELPRDLQKIAFYSFSQYGHKCCFGTYENTLGARSKAVPSPAASTGQPGDSRA